MSEFYKKAYIRGALESWNLYINDTEMKMDYQLNLVVQLELTHQVI
jgi:hypothetical protein